ncbi:thiamine pyrophosphate-binding protein [Streptomyces sp. NPDC091272]|uniref:alpha-keto acid decarboxylase family protein n=1 Tax=Streptomyces sp. NPDC091272 TaxID=3365981 RepID=UPI00382FC74F
MTSIPTDGRPTVVDHLLDRLSALGVRHVFGMAGDYNLKVLDRVLDHPDVRWIGTASELGAAYAADAYGRTRGFGALLTTLGVGELSAINGVAGAYAERVPLLHIAVGPTRATERAGDAVHHTMGDGDFDRFARAHRHVVCADAVLRPDNAAAEIDRVLTTCLRESRPGYLRVPRDVALAPLPPHISTTSLVGPTADTDADSVEAFRAAARARLAVPGSVAVLADFLVDRFGARDELAALLTASSFPSATLGTGRTVIDARTRGHLGLYAGAMSGEPVRSVIDDADLLIRAGVLLADANTGKFTHRFNPREGIDLQPREATVDGVAFPGVPLATALAVLTELVGARAGTAAPEGAPGPESAPGPGRPPEDPAGTQADRRPATGTPATGTPATGTPATGKRIVTALRRRCPFGPRLTQAQLWKAVGDALEPGHSVVADEGTPLFGAGGLPFPSGTRFVAQPLWGSIGYGLPALLGVQLADPSRRGLLVIGDGGAQPTVQELGTIGRHGLTPVVLLVNNHGYTVERVLNGARAVYNDVARWDWSRLPAALGVRDPLVLTVRSPAALRRALARAAATPDRFVLIEAMTGRLDVPPGMKRLSANRPDRTRWVP